MIISEKTNVTDAEIYELRASIRWDNDPGIYERVLKGVNTYFIARDKEKLIGFVSIISDEVADAFLVNYPD